MELVEVTFGVVGAILLAAGYHIRKNILMGYVHGNSLVDDPEASEIIYGATIRGRLDRAHLTLIAGGISIGISILLSILWACRAVLQAM